MIKRLIKVLQLSSLGHSWFLHEERRLNEFEVPLLQPVHPVVNERLVESYAGPCKVVPSVTCNFDTSLKVNSIKPE